MSNPSDRDDRNPRRLTPAPGKPEQAAFVNLPRQRALNRFYAELNSPDGLSEEMKVWWQEQY